MAFSLTLQCCISSIILFSLSMVHHTKGIVLRTIKYGETSLICTVFTDLLGVQSYMVKGVRTAKKNNNKGNILFPSSLLDMVVYHQSHKNLQIIKEYSTAHIYQNMPEDIIKNSVALFAVEVLSQIILADHIQPELFDFAFHFFTELDATQTAEVANFPLFFLIQSAKISGYFISGSYSTETPYVHLLEGVFSKEMSKTPPLIAATEADLLSRLNKANDMATIQKIVLNATQRHLSLEYFITFLSLHIPHFKAPRSWDILRAILH
jgi:DNA repair protein RecO (recombination protein O)